MCPARIVKPRLMSTRSGKRYDLSVDTNAQRNNNRSRQVSPPASPSAMLAAASAVPNVNPVTAFVSSVTGFIALKATGTYNLATDTLAWLCADQFRACFIMLSVNMLVFLLYTGVMHAIVRQVCRYVPLFDMLFSLVRQDNSTHDFTNHTNFTNFSNFNTTNATTYEAQRDALFQRLKNTSMESAMLPMVTLGVMYYMETLLNNKL